MNTELTIENRKKKIALTIADELAGGLQNIAICTGCKFFFALSPKPDEGIAGGLGFRYARRLAKNRSNLVKIYALANGMRNLEWYYFSPKMGLSSWIASRM